MGNSFEVELVRFDPDAEKEYLDTYELEYYPSMTVLEVLEEIRRSHDSSLGFRSSCRSGKCGSCAVNLDGKPVLACRTTIEGNDIRIGPQENFPVVRDLIVDKSEFDDGQKRALSYAAEVSGESPAATMSEEDIDYFNLSRCIGCMVCESVCPISGEMQASNKGKITELPDPSWMTTVAGAGIRTGERGEYLPLEESLDYCSLCETCERACPSGVDLSKLIAGAKKAYKEEKGYTLRDALMTRPDYLGKLASLVPGISNKMLSNGFVRKVMEGTLDIDSRANVFSYSTPFEKWFRKKKLITESSSARHKVAYFVGCFNNYSDTGPAKDMVKVLDRLGVYVEVPHQVCCGMPSLGKGNLDKARELAWANLAGFESYLERGYDVVTACTSGSLMLKDKYTEVLGLAGAEEMANSTYDLGEYIKKLIEEEDLNLELGRVESSTAYHTPCHLKSQEIGRPFVELLKKIPGLEFEDLDTGCCGLSGSFGYQSNRYEISQGVASELYRAIEQAKPDKGVSECGACQLQMEGGTGLTIEHPITILRRSLEAEGE